MGTRHGATRNIYVQLVYAETVGVGWTHGSEEPTVSFYDNETAIAPRNSGTRQHLNTISSVDCGYLVAAAVAFIKKDVRGYKGGKVTLSFMTTFDSCS